MGFFLKGETNTLVSGLAAPCFLASGSQVRKWVWNRTQSGWKLACKELCAKTLFSGLCSFQLSDESCCNCVGFRKHSSVCALQIYAAIRYFIRTENNHIFTRMVALLEGHWRVLGPSSLLLCASSWELKEIFSIPLLLSLLSPTFSCGMSSPFPRFLSRIDISFFLRLSLWWGQQWGGATEEPSQRWAFRVPWALHWVILGAHHGGLCTSDFLGSGSLRAFCASSHPGPSHQDCFMVL